MFMVDYKSPWLVKIVSDNRRNMSSKRKWKQEQECVRWGGVTNRNKWSLKRKWWWSECGPGFWWMFSNWNDVVLLTGNHLHRDREAVKRVFYCCHQRKQKLYENLLVIGSETISKLMSNPRSSHICHNWRIITVFWL